MSDPTSKTTAEEVAFEKGMEAFSAEKDYLSPAPNPYPANSLEHSRWENGYEAASDGAWDVWTSGY